MTIIERINNKYALQCLLFDLEEKEHFAVFEKIGRNTNSLFVIVYEQQDWEDYIYTFSEKLHWEDAVIKLNGIKDSIKKRNSYFSYNESDLRVTFAANNIDVHEYRIVTAKEAEEIIKGLYETHALDCDAPKGWSRQLYL